MKKIAIRVSLLLSVIILSAASLTRAGDLNAPAGPSDSGSAMFTLEDLYNRLNTGATGVKRSGPFAEPAAAPSSTMHNLNDIMNKAPVTDNTAGAGPEHVLSGKTYWGLQSGQWGLQTGTRLGGITLKPGGTFSPGNRWYDNADGTITDTTTGLVWLKTLPVDDRTLTAGAGMIVMPPGTCTPSIVTTQIDCIQYCGNLQNGSSGLTDGSRVNDWRPPTIREMQSLMTGPEAIGGGNFQVFSGSTGYNYWTISQDPVDVTHALTINIVTGVVTGKLKNTFGVNAIRGLLWPVRNALLP